MALQYYPFGFLDITGQPNENETTKYLSNIAAFKNYMDTANRNTAQENELARNHPATNAGIFLGNILGNWGGWRAGQMFQKYLEGKQQPDFKVPPMSQGAINRFAEKMTGSTIQQKASQAMGGYTPPQDYNFDLNDYTNLTPQNYNSAQNWKNDLISKHSLQPLQNYLTQQNSTPQTSTSTQFNFNPNNFNFSDAAKKISAMLNSSEVDFPFQK